MAILDVDAFIAGLLEPVCGFNKQSITTVAGGYFSLWDAPGQPGAGSLSIGNTTTGVIPTDATAGAFPFTNPSSGNSYLARAAASLASVGSLILYDRLHHSGSYTSVNGNINTTDMTAIDRGSDGAGVEVWAEINSALSAVATTITITYTNQDGTAGRTGSVTLPASAITRRMFPFALQSGDTGVRSIENIAGSAAPTGTFNIVMLRSLAEIAVSLAGVAGKANFVELGMPRIYNDACIAMMYVANTTTSGQIKGSFKMAQG